MSPASRRKLRDAWFGPFTADHLARRHHLSGGQTVRNFWQEEKAAGRLPHGPRPHFAEFTTLTPVAARDEGAAVDAAADLALDREIERAEQQADVGGCRIPPGDPLLAALKSVHRGDRCRRFVPRIPDDTRAMPPAMATPGHARCLARRWDQSLAAFARAASAAERAASPEMEARP